MEQKLPLDVRFCPVGPTPVVKKEPATLWGGGFFLRGIWEVSVHRPLFILADFFSKPPGFYVIMAAALVCALLTNATLGTYIISISALCLTGVVLIQNYRDTTAMQAKLNEIIVALDTARNEVVGLEHMTPEHIDAELKNIEARATEPRITDGGR